MRWAGAVRVRNEEDILEASIRHNLAFVDRLAVVDHASDDATSAILEALVHEGLSLAVERDDALEAPPATDAGARLDRLLDQGADLAIALGADDFLRIGSRDALERIVDAAPSGARLRLAVAIARPGPTGADIAQRLHAGERLIDPRPPRHAVEVRLARSRHAGTGATIDVDPTIASVLRVPVRGAGQYAARVAVGQLARMLAGRPDLPADATTDGFAGLLAGRAFDETRLLDALVNDGREASERIDPRRASFAGETVAAAMVLRHTPAGPPRPLARVLRFGERVAAGISAATGGL
jgi:hypothetical protein